jgi:thymidylate synthase
MSMMDLSFNALAKKVLEKGHRKPSRVGDTVSLPGLSISTAPLIYEFPLLSNRKIFYYGILGELAAFLQGATTLREFKDFGCNFWDENARVWPPNKGLSKEEWQVGRIYGAHWRQWEGWLDQLHMVVDSIKQDPCGRRHIMTTWNPAELEDMCLAPCHLLVQFLVYGDMLDAVVYMRSVDIALGLPSDIITYAVLTMLIAKETGYQPGQVHFQFGDAHVYEAHFEKLWQQIGRIPRLQRPLAQLQPHATPFNFHPDMLEVLYYEPQDAIKFELLV